MLNPSHDCLNEQFLYAFKKNIIISTNINKTTSNVESNNTAENSVSYGCNKRLNFDNPNVAALNSISAPYQASLLSSTIVITNDTSKAQISNNINRMTNSLTTFSKQTEKSTDSTIINH